MNGGSIIFLSLSLTRRNGRATPLPVIARRVKIMRFLPWVLEYITKIMEGNIRKKLQFVTSQETAKKSPLQIHTIRTLQFLSVLVFIWINPCKSHILFENLINHSFQLWLQRAQLSEVSIVNWYILLYCLLLHTWRWRFHFPRSLSMARSTLLTC